MISCWTVSYTHLDVYKRQVQGQVLVGQLAQVAHQLGFAVVAVEYFVLQDRRLAQQILRQAAGDLRGQVADGRGGLIAGEQCQQRLDGRLVGGFVQRKTQTLGVDLAQVDAGGTGLGMQLGGFCLLYTSRCV